MIATYQNRNYFVRWAAIPALLVFGLAAGNAPASLVANWRLDETSGAAISDANATYNGTVSATQNQPGKIGTAYSFSGGSNVNVNPGGGSAPPAPAPSPVGTVSAWINPTAVSTGNIVYLQNPTFIQFRTEPNDALTYRQDGGHDRVASSSASAIAHNTWTHVLATIDPAAIRLYINETLVFTAAGSNGYVSNDSTFLQIGAGAGNNFIGSIDDVAIWDTVLTAGKVGALSTILNANGGALNDYDAFKVNDLFMAYDNAISQPVSSNVGLLTWSKFTGGSGTAGTVTYSGGTYQAWFTDTDGVQASQEVAVPEPATFALALVGLLGLAVLVWRRK